MTTCTTVILVDTSYSMNAPVLGGQRRIDLLSAILKNVLLPGMHLVAFNDVVTAIEPGQQLPEPNGATSLHLALDYVSRMSPRRVIIISDGEPADDKAALVSARALNCVISTFYCGEETNRSAIAFLNSLRCVAGAAWDARRSQIYVSQKSSRVSCACC